TQACPPIPITTATRISAATSQRSMSATPLALCSRPSPPWMQNGLAKQYLSIYLSIMFRQDAILDLAFQALADPSRRAMVDRLVRGPATVSELAQPLAMSLPGVMQHLKLL